MFGKLIVWSWLRNFLFILNNSLVFINRRSLFNMNVCVFVRLSEILWNYKKVNATSAEARLAPGSCTVEYKQLDMCTQSLQCCSAWPKPILPIPKMQTMLPQRCNEFFLLLSSNYGKNNMRFSLKFTLVSWNKLWDLVISQQKKWQL